MCTVSEDGGQVVQSHGGQRGSDPGQYNGPLHVAVDDQETVFVADFINRRVNLLSPTLEFVRQVVSPGKLNAPAACVGCVLPQSTLGATARRVIRARGAG